MRGNSWRGVPRNVGRDIVGDEGAVEHAVELQPPSQCHAPSVRWRVLIHVLVHAPRMRYGNITAAQPAGGQLMEFGEFGGTNATNATAVPTYCGQTSWNGAQACAIESAQSGLHGVLVVATVHFMLSLLGREDDRSEPRLVYVCTRAAAAAGVCRVRAQGRGQGVRTGGGRRVRAGTPPSLGRGK